MPDSDRPASKHTAAQLNLGRIAVYALLIFLLLIATAILIRLRGHPQSIPADATSEPRDSPANTPHSADPASIGIAPTPPTAAPTEAEGRRIDPPASLQGTTVDGAISVVDGRIQATRELRRLFDYFLSALGEMDLAQIRRWLLQYVESEHGAATASEAGLMFDRYIEFQQAAEALSIPADDLRARHSELVKLRRRLLGDALADAFYADEERYLEHTLARLDLAKDPRLSAAEREQALARLQEQLPEHERDAYEQATAGLLAEEQSRQFERLNADPQTRRSEREALFGKDAAQRLNDLDTQRLQWQQRVDQYRRERDAIRADTRLNTDQRQRRLAELLARSFDQNEQRRVLSLEAIGQL